MEQHGGVGAVNTDITTKTDSLESIKSIDNLSAGNSEGSESSGKEANPKIASIIIAIIFGSFVSILSISTINIAIPIMMGQFHTDLATMQWALTGFMLAMGSFAPGAGYLGERFSYKRLYLFALIGFVTCSLFCAVAWSATSLIVFRFLQGACSGLIMPATMTIIYQVVPREKQAVAVSLWSLSSMLAPAFGPTLSGWILQHLSWHYLFLINIPIGIIAIALVTKLIPYYRLQVPKRFDLWGLITVVFGSLAILIAFSQGHTWGWSSREFIALLSTGVSLLALFIWRERVTEAPLLNLGVFRFNLYTLAIVISSIMTISLYSGTFLTPVFLQNIQHVSPLDTGLILLPSSLVMAVCTFFVGRLYNVVGPKILIFIGVILIVLGTLEMSWLSVGTPHMYIIVWMTVRNIGIALTNMPANNAAMEVIPLPLTGHASSMSNWIRNVTGSFAIALFASMLASRAQTHASEMVHAGLSNMDQISLMSYTLSVDDVYLLATGIALLALPLSLWLRKLPLKTTSTTI